MGTRKAAERRRLVTAADAAGRLDAAAAWLAALPPDAEVLVVAPSWDAADDVVRTATAASGARFGTARTTVDRLAATLAAPALAAAGLAPATGLALVAVVARAVHALLGRRGLSHFAAVAARPGFPVAVAATFGELGMHGVGADALAPLVPAGADLAALRRTVDDELAANGLADRARVFAAAVAAIEAGVAPAGRPVLLLDLPLATALEAGLVAALAARAPDALATVPAGDARAAAALERALGVTAEPLPPPPSPASLGRLQQHLFADVAPPPAPLDASVAVRSWPGEARECVEIVRAVQRAAADGTPFDAMAVFLHAPAPYAAQLEEAFARADVPAYFARGSLRPHPAGRALLALLACAAEGLSARRFAEYLSLAQVPDPGSAGDGWAPPREDLLPTAPAAAVEPPRDDDVATADVDASGVVAGTLRAPARWERLLVDAAVIGGADRWRRRLDGLDAELARKRAEVRADDEARAALLDRTRRDLAHLRAFALPLVERLAALPRRAPWGTWLEHLRALAAAALREPEPVLATLAELAPMAPVGPVELDEVQLVLGPRLREAAAPPPRRRYGAVFVGPTAAARGLAFDVVFVPGLAERVFPGQISEDPILPDAARAALDAPMLATAGDRLAAERLALRLAVGSARRRVVLSYPRLEVELARRRVPSFYVLEALKAAEGRLPGFGELTERVESTSPARLGWPAPEDAKDAIDDAEYDLTLVAPLLEAPADEVAGAAHYLLGTNPHLARALRARARRWIRRWTSADGLVDDPVGQAALARHRTDRRAFSPTALQHFAACPYRFFLQAVHRLAPREEPVAVERLDPLTRGQIVHDTQFKVLSHLAERGLLPVGPAGLEPALAAVDAALRDVAAAYHEELAPAIDRVWADAIDAVRADLREWLRRAARADDGWVPWRFELSFGITDRDRTYEDPASVAEPVPILDGALTLRGSIDLVERQANGVLRITDYKTGKVRAREGFVTQGGEILQPVLYALAAERLLHASVAAGRLYYCTADGGFTERTVTIDATARETAAAVARTIADALAEGFLPAAPDAGACRFCDYRPVCGPHEEARVRRKPAERLAALARLRGLP